MKTHILLAGAVLTATLFSHGDAFARGDFKQREVDARIMKLEQRVLELREKQGLSGSPDVTGRPSQASQSAASTQARIDALDEQMRRIRGDNERTQHLLENLNKKLDTMNGDIDFRLGEIERRGSSSASAAGDGSMALDVPPLEEGTISFDVPPEEPAAAAAPTPTKKPEAPALIDDAAPNPLAPSVPVTQIRESNAPKMQIKISDPVSATPTAATIAPQTVLKPQLKKIPLLNDDGASFTVPSFSSPREHYNYAFGLMNKARYEEAGDVFASFLQRYPKDGLRGNVYYWLGETFYVRENYNKSIDNFRLGFEENPEGNKAPDNLLKLAMSLEKVNKVSEGCLVLDKLVEKYPSPQAVSNKAQEQLEKWTCQSRG